MKYLKLFENFEGGIIPDDIIQKLHSTDNENILEYLKNLQDELDGDKDESALRAYVDDIGIALDDTDMDKKEADEIYFKLVDIVDKNGIDITSL